MLFAQEVIISLVCLSLFFIKRAAGLILSIIFVYASAAVGVFEICFFPAKYLVWRKDLKIKKVFALTCRTFRFSSVCWVWGGWPDLGFLGEEK